MRDNVTLRRAAGPGLVIVLSSVALALLDASGQAFWQGLVINLGIFVILTVSLNLTSGFTGVFSLGQIGFMALGVINECLRLCTDYARNRKLWGQEIGRFQLIQLRESVFWLAAPLLD